MPIEYEAERHGQFHKGLDETTDQTDALTLSPRARTFTSSPRDKRALTMTFPRLALKGDPPPTPPATAKDLKVWLDEEDMLMSVVGNRCSVRSGAVSYCDRWL